MLRETIRLEEFGFAVEDLPLLSVFIRIVEDCFTITSQHASLFETAHDANTVAEMLESSTVEHDGNKVLEDLDQNVFIVTQIHVKDMLMVVGLCMRDGVTRYRIRQVSTSLTIQVVDPPTRHFKSIGTDSERGSGNVGEVTSDLRTDVDVQPQARLK
jgi:hypothetical protein